MIYQKYTGENELKNIGRKNLLLSKDEVIYEQQEEIERLSKMLEDKFYKEYPFIVENGIICKKNKEIERLRSIIKEAKEHINEKLNINSDYVDYDFGTELLRHELLQILEKAEEK